MRSTPTSERRPREAGTIGSMDRNFIYGIIAVQLGYASPQQVMAAASALFIDGSKSMAELLVAHGVLTEESRRKLDGILEDALRARGFEENTTLESLGGDGAVFASIGGSLVDVLGGKPSGDEPSSDSVDEQSTIFPELAGRYRMKADAEIGRGGIGRVLVAFDTGLGREIAVKELLTDTSKSTLSTPRTDHLSRTSAIAARFLREARVTGQLEHPNIVPVYEVGRRENGTLYYTMKLVRGRTLAEALRECHDLSERLKLLHHYVDLCNAVAYAHSRGVVHRDIKPENVMLGEFGETVVLDWGLAKLKGRKDIRRREIQRGVTVLQEATEGKTVDGAAIGTPAYMSPEQAEGRIEDIDEMSDVWSLGAVLYELLTGKPPFEGYSPYEIIGKVIKDAVIPPREKLERIPAELSAVAMKALARDKSLRYETAERLASEITAYMAGGRIAAYEYGSLELLSIFVRKNKAASVLVALLVVLTGLSAVILARAYGEANRERQVAVSAQSRAEEQSAIATRESKTAQANFSLALAEKSATSAAETNFLEARLFAAKALQLSPYNPRSPNRFADPEKLSSPEAARARTAIQSSLYDALNHASFRFHAQLAGHTALVHALSFSPDGTQLASTSDDGTILLQSIARSSDHDAPRNLTLRGHDGPVLSVAWSPHGETIVSGGKDGDVRVWKVSDGTSLGTVTKHSAAVRGVVYARNGEVIASVDEGGTLKLTPVDKQERPRKRELKKQAVGGLALSPNGKLLVVGTSGDVLLLRADDLREVARLGFDGHAAYAVGFSPDGSLVGASGSSSLVRVWNTTEHTPVATMKGSNIDQLDFALTKDNRQVVVVDDGSVGVWGLSTQRREELLRMPRSFVRAMAVGPDDSWVALGEESGRIGLWRHGRAAARALAGLATPMFWVDAALGGTRLVSADWLGSVRVWDSAAGKQVQELQAKGPSIWRINVSHDGQRVVWGDFAGQIQVWDLTKPERIGRWKGTSEQLRGVVWSPQGDRIASAGMEEALKVWRPSGELLETVALAAGTWWLEWTPDGQRIVLGGFDGKLRVVETKTWKVVHELSGHDAIISGLAVAPDSSTVVSTSKDGTARVWNIVEGRCERVFRGHNAWVNRGAISPDGKWVLTSSDDSTVRLWELANGRESLVLRRSSYSVAVRFVSGGKQLLINNGADMEVLPFEPDLWSSDPQRVLSEAEKEAGMRLEGMTIVPLK